MIDAEKEYGNIFEIQKMSTEDGPGLRTTVFFKSCPLRCKWCHNPESFFAKPSIQWFETRCIGCGTCLEVCPENAIYSSENRIHIKRDICTSCGKCVEECPSTALQQLGKKISLDDLFKEVSKDKQYYKKSDKGGITVSGGEAALQSEFLERFLKLCKKNGFHTALDTCGFVSKKNYKKILPYIDLILYDLKEIDPVKHKEFTDQSNEIILENCKWLLNQIKNSDKKMWIRTPIIPEFTATKENVRGIGEFIYKELENQIERWDLLSFNNLAKDKYERMDLPYYCNGLDLLTKEKMENFLEIAEKTGVRNIKWSGMTKN